MSGVALYNVLTKLGATPEEAKEAIADVASSKEVATKADLKTGLAELKETLTWRMVLIAGIIIGVLKLWP